jgi:nitrogen-specific signal transduction histidine kinase
MEKQLQKVNEIENNGTRAYMLDTEMEILTAALATDKVLKEADKKVMRNAIAIMGNWSKKLKEISQSQFNRLVTNSLQMQIMAVNGNTDREFIKKYVASMPALDALNLRKYIEKNKPGIDFDIEVERPESLGGGSFKTFLNWDDSVFLNIPDL